MLDVFSILNGVIVQWIGIGALLKFERINKNNYLYKISDILIKDYALNHNLVKIDFDNNQGETIDKIKINFLLNVKFDENSLIQMNFHHGNVYNIKWVGEFDNDETAQLFYMNDIGEL